MRNFTASELSNIKLITDKSIEMTYLEPTLTGLKKSIMDATGIVRSYFKTEKIHDFNQQKQGPKYKKFIKGVILTDKTRQTVKVSLYRPVTKQGDPRIWIYGLGKYVSPNDVISLIVYEGKIYIFNLTRIDLKKVLDEAKSPLNDFIKKLAGDENKIALELLNKLKKISELGPVQSLVEADTGVGRTLEKLLGIKMNSDKNPDYRGIELKSFRSGKTTNRQTLFAKVPDWSISKFKSSAEILQNFGYIRDNLLRLNCTVSCKSVNSQGLSLKINHDQDLLMENSTKLEIGDFVAWRIKKLQDILLAKHKETFWIKAESIRKGGKEYFLYKHILHTRDPIESQFVPLLEQGKITVDHLIKKKSNNRISERGPLFKIRKNSITLLIPESKTYSLS